MIININSISELEESLALYFNITKEELYYYLNSSYDEDWEVFEDNLRNSLLDLEIQEEIDEIYLYHLSRRLETDNKKAYCLRDALVNDTSLKSFFENYSIVFKDNCKNTEVYYNNKLIPLDKDFHSDDSLRDNCLNNLAVKLGHREEKIIDNSLNGFIFKGN